jgi:hypothetical protein
MEWRFIELLDEGEQCVLISRFRNGARQHMPGDVESRVVHPEVPAEPEAGPEEELTEPRGSVESCLDMPAQRVEPHIASGIDERRAVEEHERGDMHRSSALLDVQVGLVRGAQSVKQLRSPWKRIVHTTVHDDAPSRSGGAARISSAYGRDPQEAMVDSSSGQGDVIAGCDKLSVTSLKSRLARRRSWGTCQTRNMFSGLPPQTEVFFEPSKYVELFRGSYHDAKPILEKLESSDLSPGVWRLSVERHPGRPVDVVISVLEVLEMQARHIVDQEMRVPPFRPKNYVEFPHERSSRDRRS